jgi:hypothetical protein
MDILKMSKIENLDILLQKFIIVTIIEFYGVGTKKVIEYLL